MTTSQMPDVDPAGPPGISRKPSPRSSLGPLTFRQPAEDETPSSHTPSPPAGEGSPLGHSPSDSDEQLGAWNDPSDSGPTSSPASSADVEDQDDDTGSRFAPLGKAALRVTTRKAILIGTQTANRLVTRAESLERLNGLYVADNEDAENIGDPLASIIHRHGGIAGGKVHPDAADAMQALMGLIGYGAKQVALTMAIRDHRDSVANGVAPAGEAA